MVRNVSLGLADRARDAASTQPLRAAFLASCPPLLAGALATAFMLAASPAYAEKVGVAAAVNPDAFSSLSGVPNKQLNIGKSIFYNERISTTTNGLVQVLLVDGSTFTVGPNSNLVIDKFVYDPRKKTGALVATFSKGSMRFIGGKLSKNAGGVKVNTPEGALAIRGGMFQGNTHRKIYSFLYGHSLTFRGRNGQTKTVYQPGYTLDLSRGAGNVRPTTAEDTAVFAKALSSRGGSNSAGNGQGGGQGGQQAGQSGGSSNQAVLAETISLQNLISDATSTAINDEIAEQEKRLAMMGPPTTEQPPAGNEPQQTNNEPPPVEVDARVIRLGAGGLVENDFVWTFEILNKRLIADVPPLNEASDGEALSLNIETQQRSEIFEALSRPALQFDFPETLTCTDGRCPVTDAKVTVDGVTTNFVGHAVLKNDFFAYHVAEEEFGVEEQRILQNPVLVFGGKKRNFEAPSGKVYIFALTSDILQGDTAPFASAGSGAIGDGNGFVSPLIAKEQNGGQDDASRPVWLQTSFALGSGDSEGQSFVNVALGEWSVDGGLQGSRRGGSDLNGDGQISFSGDIASLSGPDGGHFLGADDENPNIVVSLGGPGTENLGADTPLNQPGLFPRGDGEPGVALVIDGPGIPSSDQGGPRGGPPPQSGATYHIGVGTDTLEDIDANGGTFKGYAAGFSQAAGSNKLTSLVNNSPNDVKLALNGETNNLTASIEAGNRHLFPDTKYKFEFGGKGNSALIDDNVFAAFEKPGGSSVSGTHTETRTETYNVRQWNWKRWRWETVTKERDVEVDVDHTYSADTQGYFVSADAINANEVLFPGQTEEGDNGPEQKRAFCQNCDFIKWGAWGSRSNYKDYKGENVTEDTHLGWWIAGDVVNASDMPTLGSASYAGDVVGTVAKLKNGAWNQAVATGDLKMNWDFQRRAGTVNINKFDGKNLQGVIAASRNSPQNFGGALVGRGKIGGTTTGSFVGSPGKGKVPGGVIGNFNAQKLNGKWRANGIYGGTQVRR